MVRGIVFARLANFVEGHAKARPLIAERIAALLDGPLPAVPLGGEDGPGEVLPLLRVLSGLEGDFEEAEPMALLNGSPCAAALAADVALAARNRLRTAERVFALSVEGFRAPLEAYDEALEALWEDEHEVAALRGLRESLAGADGGGRLGHQAPVSYRILPRVLGQAHRAVAAVEHAARVSLRSVTDNPVYVLPDERHPVGRAISTGGYHNGIVYPALSVLAAAWADLVLLTERHLNAMHVGATAGHLPRLLERPDGGGGRTNLLGWVAGSFLEDARAAAAVTLLPAGIADAQNDVAAPTFAAYRKQRTAASALDAALAVLAASSSQALWASDREPAPPLQSLLDGLRSIFPPVDDPAGRRVGDELARLATPSARLRSPARSTSLLPSPVARVEGARGASSMTAGKAQLAGTTETPADRGREKVFQDENSLLRTRSLDGSSGKSLVRRRADRGCAGALLAACAGAWLPLPRLRRWRTASCERPAAMSQ